jgi:hypothetical protein
MTATLGLGADLIEFGCLTTNATLGLGATRIGRACLTITAAFGLAAVSVMVKSVPDGGKSTSPGSNHPIGSRDAPA